MKVLTITYDVVVCIMVSESIMCLLHILAVSAVRDSPIEADRKHEPNAVLEPVKGILITQVSTLKYSPPLR